MGPPSRYALLAQAERRALEAQVRKLEENDVVDTFSLTNTEWVKYHLRRLVTASTEDEFHVRAKQCFSRRTNVTLNGLHVSRELYAQQWVAGLRPHGCGSLNFQGDMETPDIKVPMMHNAALVGLFFTAKFCSGDLAEESIEVSSTTNIIVAEDKSLSVSVTDRRRMFTINQVLVDKAGALTFPVRNEF